ncbi:DNA methyltransferase [Bifidobacterium pseudolongum subsp. pseudolongum]|nr:DNA methyltransferase [Bifidobacterium pseudolongum subsp. pseudolongum]PKV08729.1 DNA methyltransferase [Bifidobacterium pseudolongum subsp. pseudolongum]RYQ49258.1 DNA methyltransferase [Bifidobacterium pseudolongum subsp. pseudolongum]RYQ52003.1 DNA methyltransferase [Bifidobacterium pseudolongum subsp. pseudolongum]RYQ53912.1 DNA methyltransferase [Bifidobacterium pseudolongum subsp. pseudolongum]
MRWCRSAAMLRYMHVITGRFKGMPLATPRAETRPTTDRTKEALFSRLESHGLLQDARVLDLFGGTGALGIEALSRGAHELVVVESSAQAAQLIAQTLTALRRYAGWQEGMGARVVHAKAERYAAKAKPGEPFDLVLIDPPYAFASADCERLLRDLTARGLVARFGAIVLERSTRTAPPAAPEGWVMIDRRDYGETAVYTFRSQEYEQIVREQSEE